MNYEMMETIYMLSQSSKSENSSQKLYSENECANIANIFSGAMVAPLVSLLETEEVNTLDLYDHIKALYEESKYLAAAYFIIMIYEAAELEIPTGFARLLEDDRILEAFIYEFMQDVEDVLDD